ncbi:MAG: hypothetical protein CVV13_14085 [Gammaproteobacteria bacterium HGW-Gammaproteobacteria-3]|nr:MAG: hypothetical protein CVV13_14085 [Gammaproteobacteria bacterium HGW-Gammaproteobacteria-3]
MARCQLIAALPLVARPRAFKWPLFFYKPLLLINKAINGMNLACIDANVFLICFTSLKEQDYASSH